MKSEKVGVNDFPELVSSGKMTTKQALGKLAEIVHEKPYCFNLPTYDEDMRNELIVRLLKNGYFIFDHYNQASGEFKAYFASFLRCQLLTIKRERVRSYYSSVTFETEKPVEYEQNLEMYKLDEYMYKMLHFTPYIPSEKEKVPYRKRKPSKCPMQPKNCKISNYCKGKNPIDAKTVLVLALKSSYYLTDDHINTVSKYCGIEPEHLHATVETIKETLKKRAEKLESLKMRRDKAYYLHKKYMFQLKNCKKEIILKNSIKEHYEIQTKNWKNKNEVLQEKSYRVCPTNKAIADMLGICERQVSYYIKNGKYLKERTLQEMQD